MVIKIVACATIKMQLIIDVKCITILYKLYNHTIYIVACNCMWATTCPKQLQGILVACDSCKNMIFF